MKKLLLTLSALSLMSSVALASPVVELQNGQSVAGYSYWNAKMNLLDSDLGKSSAKGFYAETAIDDKTIISIETMRGTKSTTFSGIPLSLDLRFTDISVKVNTDEKVQLILGNRSYDLGGSIGGTPISNTENKLFYGLGATTEFSKNTSGYASFTHSSVANDWQVGANCNLSKNATLNLNYRAYVEDGFSIKGLGAGLAYKF